MKQIYIENKPTSYYITSEGKLYNEKTNTWYKGRISKSGYLDYIIRIDGKEKSLRAHRLVAQYFLENPNNYNIVNHKDGNKLNNDVNNLEWVTQSQNIFHAYSNNLIKKKKNPNLSFEKSSEDEEWRDCHYNTLYKISNKGRVLNSKTNKILSGKTDTGYYRYELRSPDKKRKTFLGHRLVYKAFNPEFDIDDRKRIINHKDGNKLNNNLNNLEETTISENIKHAYQTGLNKKIRPIYQFDLQMNFIREFPSANEAARQIGCYQGLITSACQRKGTSKGFYWRYKDEYQKDVQRL